jgi:hypothetical protein
VLSVCLAALVGQGCSDRSRSQFASAAIARQEGIFTKGWVPDVFPENAGPLVEHHDLDTNARCAMVRLDDEGWKEVADRARELKFAVYETAPSPPALDWCPFTDAERRRARLVLMRATERDREFIAYVDGALYFWSSD